MLQSIDLFPSNFQFSISRHQKGHKTNQGGFLTLLIISTSLAYLIFLVYSYFAGNIYPKITNVQITSEENANNIIEYSKSPFIFNLLFLENSTSVKRSYYSLLIFYKENGS
jgi:hypothetical protein